MSDPWTSPEYLELVKRHNQMAFRCMAMEQVMRGVATWLVAALPEASAERFLKGLEAAPDNLVDENMPPAQVRELRKLVQHQQVEMVKLIRTQAAEARKKAGAAA